MNNGYSRRALGTAAAMTALALSSAPTLAQTHNMTFGGVVTLTGVRLLVH